MFVGPGDFDVVVRDGGPVVVVRVAGGGTVERDRLAPTDAGRRGGDAWLVAGLAARGADAGAVAAFLTDHLRRTVVASEPATAGDSLARPWLAIDAVRSASAVGSDAGSEPHSPSDSDGHDTAESDNCDAVDATAVVERHVAGRERVDALVSAGRVPGERRGLADALSATRARRAGTALLATGTVDEAREWFRTAADEYCEALAGERERYADLDAVCGEGWPLLVREALSTALLSGDDGLLADAAREAALLPDGYYREHPATTAWFHYARLLATVALAPDPGVAMASGHAARSPDAEDPLAPLRPPVDESEYPRVAALYEPLGDPLGRYTEARMAAVGTIYESDDPERVGEALLAVLSTFADDDADGTAVDAVREGPGSCRPGAVCLDAVALLALADRHGFDVTIDAPGLPAAAADLVGT